MTPHQRKQFNIMLLTLRNIADGYQAPEQLRRSSQIDYGLDYEECLEMAYENIQEEARRAVRGVRPIQTPTPKGE